MNRIITWTANGIEYEGDQRHVEIAQKSIQLPDKGKGVVTPADKSQLKGDVSQPLTRRGKRQFRGLVARMDYLGQDRSDIQFALKECSTAMSNPGTIDMAKMKRLARYLLRVPRCVVKFDYQSKVEELVAWSDSDFAGCMKS